MPFQHPHDNDQPAGPGFEDMGAAFERAPADADTLRFEQKVELMRLFSVIESGPNREQIIALARRLASGVLG